VTRSGNDFGDRELDIAHACAAMLKILHSSDGSLEAAGRLELLTLAERYVLDLYGMGLSVRKIAEHRGTTIETVRTQLKNGCSTLQLAGRSRKLAIARVLGYAPPPALPADRLARLLDC
ncbi:MAG: hypothetical protein ACRDTA_25790, partial [Pseudonocardiaceae bacterium]